MIKVLNANQESIDSDMGVRANDISLMVAILRGAMIVWENDRALLVDRYHGGPINIEVTQYVKKGDYKLIQSDDRLTERTLHLDDEWSGAKDGRLRRVIFSKLNQAALDNAYRTEQGLLAEPIVRVQQLKDMPASSWAATENVVEVGVRTYFEELELLDVFKFADDDDQLVLAIKVGGSTAIIGIILDDDRRPKRKPGMTPEKIRLKKSTLVCRILPRVK